MEKNELIPEETTPTNIPEVQLSEAQLAEQLYNNAGLNSVIDAGLKDYDESLQKEDKFITKVFGPRGNDIRGYGQAVAKRVAIAVFDLLNQQYGGRMGDLKSYINKLEDDRDRANARYDELMGRVVGILGDEYKELRIDSNNFMEKLTTLMGDEAESEKIDQKALAESLADIDGLRSRIKELELEAKSMKSDYEAQIKTLTEEKQAEQKESQKTIGKLEKDNAALDAELKELKSDHARLVKAVTDLSKGISEDAIGKNLSEELYNHMIEDSQIPQMVISGVGKFIDFKKYLGDAATKGAIKSKSQAIDALEQAQSK
ncbi:MAG: hypothetical protein ACRKGH_02460 [Dehalogenimonas sp.]